MGRRIKVVCTGGGRHGQKDLYELDITAESITQVMARVGASPLTGEVSGFEDGEPVTGNLHHKALLPVPSVKSEPTGPWRRRCPSCKQDWPLTDDTVRRWAAGSVKNTLDVSTRRNVSDP